MTKESKKAKKQTKKYLRTLTRDGGKHPIRHTSRVIKYGVSGFGRNIWLSLASILVMTITLSIIIVTVISNVILNATATELRDRIDITVFLKPETTDATLSELSSRIKLDENVKKDSVITKNSKQEVELYLEENSDEEDMIEMITTDKEMYDIFVKNMPATLRFKVYDVSDLSSIKSIINTDPTFATSLHEDKEDYSPTYDMNQAEIATINSWANIAKNGGIILGVIFLVISILVIFNTVRMAVFSRREEIYMMKLIGGSRSFIRGPFLVEAAITGLISGLISCTLAYFGFKFLAPRLSEYGINIASVMNFYDKPILLSIFFAAILVIGMFIGVTAAHLAAKKYLRKL